MPIEPIERRHATLASRRVLNPRAPAASLSTVDGLIRLMNTPGDVTGPINIGNPNEITVKELAERILAMTGSKAELKLCDLPADDPKQRQPDIARARELLKWER